MKIIAAADCLRIISFGNADFSKWYRKLSALLNLHINLILEFSLTSGTTESHLKIETLSWNSMVVQVALITYSVHCLNNNFA